MTKTRVSLSIDKNLIKDIDSRIDGIVVRSRSDAVEKILREHVIDRKTAVILAGGTPHDLIIKELNEIRPLVNIGRKTLIEDIILKCRESGFVNIIIIGFSPVIARIYEILGDGNKYGVKINYLEEKETLGSAKTLELAKNYIKSDFLFIPCDHYFDFDLKKLHNFHLQNNGVVTLSVYTKDRLDSEAGIVEMDGYNIINYEEKPGKAKTFLSSIFIGFMKLEIFNLIPPGQVHWSLQNNIFPKLAKEGKVIGYPVAGNWINVHTKEDVDLVRSLK